jgi:hypothetical protein
LAARGIAYLSWDSSYLAPFSRTGKMPVKRENILFVEQASCLFIKGLLTMVQHLRIADSLYYVGSNSVGIKD